jgi:hypothetical protein
MATARKVANAPKAFLIEPEVFYPIEVIAEKLSWVNTRNVNDHLFKNGLKHIKLGSYIAVYGADLLEFMLDQRQ